MSDLIEKKFESLREMSPKDRESELAALRSIKPDSRFYDGAQHVLEIWEKYSSSELSNSPKKDGYDWLQDLSVDHSHNVMGFFNGQQFARIYKDENHTNENEEVFSVIMGGVTLEKRYRYVEEARSMAEEFHRSNTLDEGH